MGSATTTGGTIMRLLAWIALCALLLPPNAAQTREANGPSASDDRSKDPNPVVPDTFFGNTLTWADGSASGYALELLSPPLETMPVRIEVR
jgi:hypothetical protein